MKFYRLHLDLPFGHISVILKLVLSGFHYLGLLRTFYAVRACTAFDVILTVVLFFTALLAYAASCCPQCLGSVPAVVNQQKNTVIVVQGVHEESSPVATVYDPSTGKVINDGV